MNVLLRPGWLRPLRQAHLVHDIGIQHDERHREYEKENYSFFHELLAKRIKAPAMKRLTFQQAPHRARHASQKPVADDRLVGIGRAGRFKAAARGEQRRDPASIETDDGQSDWHQAVSFRLISPARANVSFQAMRSRGAATPAASRFGRTSTSQPAAIRPMLKRANSRKRRLHRLRCVAPPSFFPTTVPTRVRSNAVPR